MKNIALLSLIAFTKIHAMDLQQSEEFICPISMEVMEEPIITSCGHIFDKKSIEAWLSKQNTCPICRKIIASCDREIILKEKIRLYNLSLKEIEQKALPEEAKRQAWEKIRQQLLEEFVSELRDFINQEPSK